MSHREMDRTSIAFGIFLVLIFSLGFMKPALEIGFASLTPTDVIFPISFVIWIAAVALGHAEFRWRSEFWVFGFYFFALALSAIFSADLQLSLRRLPGAFYLILLAIVTASIVSSHERLRLTILAWIAGSVPTLLAAFVAIGLFYLSPESTWLSSLTYHYGAVPVGNFPRISSTFVSASMFCNYLTVTLILVLLSIKMRWIGSVVAVVLIAMIAVAAIFTVSIALGGLFLAVGLWIWLSTSDRNSAKFALALTCSVAIAFLFIAPFSLIRPAGEASFSTLHPSSRLLVWQDATQTIRENPITGRGVGTAAAEVTFQNSDESWSLLTDAHNTFLSVAAQSGLIGLLALVAILVVTLRRGFDRDRGALITRALGAAFLAAFVYDGLTSSFEDTRHLWVLIGLVFASGGAEQDQAIDSTSLDGA